jgi:hypothetical protein
MERPLCFNKSFLLSIESVLTLPAASSMHSRA